MIEQVRQWLSSEQDYLQGIELLKQVGGSAVLIGILTASGPTKFNRTKLEKVLLEMVNKYVAPEAEALPQSEYPKYDVFKLPIALQRAHERKAELYRMAGNLRKKLCSEPPVPLAEAATLTEQIMRAMQENQRLWEQINYFLETGDEMKQELPVIPELEGKTVAELARFKNNNASNLSKWRKKLLLLPEGEMRTQLAERIQTHERLQEEVMKML